MTAIEALTIELRKVQAEQVSCINTAGYVLSERRYYYADLVKQAREYQLAIKYLSTIKEVSNDTRTQSHHISRVNLVRE